MTEDINKSIDEEELEDEVAEVILEKDKSRSDRIKQDWHKALARFKLIKNIRWRVTNHPLGYYRNNNEANANTGGAKKTNTRKSSANYRHKGGYGKADKYSPKDQRQLDNMKDSQEEYNAEEEI